MSARPAPWRNSSFLKSKGCPAEQGTNDMLRPQPSKQVRNQSSTRKNWDKVEQHLTEVEKAQGFARAWQLREQLERGDITLDELRRR
jgi:hypothetical protein